MIISDYRDSRRVYLDARELDGRRSRLGSRVRGFIDIVCIVLFSYSRSTVVSNYDRTVHYTVYISWWPHETADSAGGDPALKPHKSDSCPQLHKKTKKEVEVG